MDDTIDDGALRDCQQDATKEALLFKVSGGPIRRFGESGALHI